MKKLLWLLLLYSSTLFAQYQVTIEATLLNQTTNEPVPFANIEFLNKDIKAIADINGIFVLSYDEERIGSMDIIRFSALGFHTEEVTAGQFYKFLKNTNVIYLKPEILRDNPTVSVKSRQVQDKPQGTVHGVVKSAHGPIQGVHIKIKNTFTEVKTNIDGQYGIQAFEGDVLVVDFLGMKSKEIQIIQEGRLDILLEPDGTLLDEVVLTGKRKKAETINLGLNGEKSFDAIGYSVNIVNAEDIKPHQLSIKDILDGKFAGVQVGGQGRPGELPGVYLRSLGSISNNTSAIYEIDGMIYESNPPPLDMQNIESITILKSLAAVNKYGTLGRGGVIVIRTKMQAAPKPQEELKSALVKGNDYNESTPLLNGHSEKPLYISALEKATSFEEAKAIYKNQKATVEITIPYILDVSDYFMRWDTGFSHQLVMQIAKIAYDNPKALKTLAYKLEERKKYQEAKIIYQRIAVLRPQDAQSYRDLASIYQSTGNYQEAMNLYKQMLGNTIESVDFSGLHQMIANELAHLLKFHRNQVDYSGIPSDYLTADFKIDTRLVFEWNDPNTEFEIQFVNPDRKYYKWGHTKIENKDRLLDEIQKGYAAVEYIIDDAKAGEWIINIESLNKDTTNNPTYLKYTVYRNYGLENETVEVKVINLNVFNPKVTFDKLVSR